MTAMFMFGSPGPTLRPMWRPSTAEGLLRLTRDGPLGCPWPDVRTLLPRALRPLAERPALGHAVLRHLDQWSALAFWGHHVDERPDAACVFVVEERRRFFDLAAAVAVAFPEVVGALRFNIVPLADT